MSTAPLPLHFNNIDPTRLWADYYYYKNAVHADSSALDGGDFEFILETMKNLLSEKANDTPHVNAADSRQRFEATVHNPIVYQSKEIYELKRKMKEQDGSLESL
ncbi:hypothetical protein K469DRAFT_792999 [Zopfia rhizophila CBS 207.26]|uniref:Uncharacterized protein n=1 Tax=Zopfia rhizophila CBS 207.26 TaxID=1314779 RepID=A0A6A6DQ60_9PEZI|nr:hypothetical protein K469DRAFT_792999 [Zopfia rhizophila CBS 207.26]